VIARCDDVDAFFDGELAVDPAQSFREHLTTCARCQAALRGRMLEAAVTDEAPGAQVIPLHAARMPARTRSRPVRRWMVAAAAVAIAAAVTLVWWVRRPLAPTVLAVVVRVEHGATQMRGTSAHIGDTIHARATGGAGQRAVWIYRDDTQLLLACPGAAGCRDGDGAMAADLVVRAVGTYSIVTISATSLSTPTGSLDADVAAARGAGALTRIDTVEVR
jgi:Putative zinc-finger